MDTITPEQIAARAYQRFVERGGEHGHDVEDWNAASEELERAARRYDVRLVDAGARVIEVVRLIRELTGMELRAVKLLVDGVPGLLRHDLSRADGEALAARLAELGARVELQALT
jgi:ribosomal protein L7/L12